MKRQYRTFRKAAQQGDAEAIDRIIRECPRLHDYEGDAGSLVDILRYESPDLLPSAFAAGLSPDAGETRPHETFLQHASANGDLDAVRLAIEFGADLQARNNSGEIALGYACSWGQLDVVKLLVEAAADVNAIEEDPRTGYRCTSLDCTHQYPEIAAYLRSNGALTLDELEPGGDTLR